MKTATKRSAGAICISILATGVLAIGPFASAAGYDRPGRTYQVDLGGDGPLASGSSQYSSLSDNGRFVAFDTEAALVPLDVNLASDVYIRDLSTGRTWLASKTVSGQVAPFLPQPCLAPWGPEEGRWGDARENHYSLGALSWDPAISGNGRYVAFASSAPLVTGDTNLVADIYLFDRIKGSLERVSVAGDGSQANNVDDAGNALCPASWSPSVDRSGRRISFTSYAANFSSGDKNSAADIFVRMMDGQGTTERVSVPSTDPVEPGPLDCLRFVDLDSDCKDADHSSISSNGRFVAFDSNANNLVEGDTNKATDVFVRDLKSDLTERVSLDSLEGQLGDGITDGTPITDPQKDGYSVLNSGGPAERNISADGRYVLFKSFALDVVPANNQQMSVYVRDRKRGTTEAINVSSWGRTFGPISGESVVSMSNNGRFIAFRGIRSTDQGDGYPSSEWGYTALVYDRLSGALEDVTRADDGSLGHDCRDIYQSTVPHNSVVDVGDISGDGRYVTIMTCNTNMQDVVDSHRRAVMRDRGGVVSAMDGSHVLRMADSRSFNSDGFVEALDPIDASLLDEGDITSARIVERDSLSDLFAVIEMARLSTTSPVTYGLRLEANHRLFEVRITSLSGGTFELFECGASSLACSKVGDLRGGYGTTGERVVFSVPLDVIGLGSGGELSGVQVFSGLGAAPVGVIKTIDHMWLR